MRFFSLIRVKYLQARALKLLENTQRVSELRLRFSNMPKNPLREMFALGDRELKIFLKTSPESDYGHRRELMDRLNEFLKLGFCWQKKI